MRPALRSASLLALLALGACTTLPSGPGVLALPGSGKSFDQFRFDEYECRQYASAQVGGTTAEQAAVDSGVKSAVIGTVVGAAAGAAMDGGRGAAVGAGVGLLGGAAAGSSAASASAYELQRRYDFAYIQCMYAKGHKVPVSGEFTHLPAGSPPAPSQPGAVQPPPPPK